jgi:hypothetical protein
VVQDPFPAFHTPRTVADFVDVRHSLLPIPYSPVNSEVRKGILFRLRTSKDSAYCNERR